VGAGIEQLMENDVKQMMEYHCNSIGMLTNYLPSCTATAPFDAKSDCDCVSKNCRVSYNRFDQPDMPSSVKCVQMTFFNSFYFLIVTVGTLGFGDLHPTTELSRFVVMLIIILSLVIIPIQVEKLGRAIRAMSMYRRPFKHRKGQTHVIICGCVNYRDKVERFLMEFFHPSKLFIRDTDIQVVLMAPVEPSEDIKDMLAAVEFSSLVSYLIGSALNADDLTRASARSALAVFFLSNPIVNDTGE
jgi:hypothetical protein